MYLNMNFIKNVNLNIHVLSIFNPMVQMILFTAELDLIF